MVPPVSSSSEGGVTTGFLLFSAYALEATEQSDQAALFWGKALTGYQDFLTQDIRSSCMISGKDGIRIRCFCREVIAALAIAE